MIFLGVTGQEQNGNNGDVKLEQILATDVIVFQKELVDHQTADDVADRCRHIADTHIESGYE